MTTSTNNEISDAVLDQLADKWIDIGLRCKAAGFVSDHDAMRKAVNQLYKDAGFEPPAVIVCGPFPYLVDRLNKALLSGYIEEFYDGEMHTYTETKMTLPNKDKLDSLRSDRLISGQFAADTGGLIEIQRMLNPPKPGETPPSEGLYQVIMTCGPGFLMERIALVSEAPESYEELPSTGSGLPPLKIIW